MPTAVPAPGSAASSPSLRRLVALARVLSGGLLVLAVVVAGVPPMLDDRGPGTGALVGHVAGALAAVAATAVAARARVPRVVATVAALVPVAVTALVLGVVWWS